MKNKIKQKIGVLGGGQLGKMLCLAAANLDLDISIMEKYNDCPAYDVCHNFMQGDITSYDDVMAFGKDKDVITIEIENVNLEALAELEKMGKKVSPSSAALKIIKDKGKQKIFYEGTGFASAEFTLYNTANEIRNDVAHGKLKLPFVQKLRTTGYDGHGVHIARTENDLNDLLEGETLVEHLVDVDKELAVIVARNSSGDLVVYPPVEMKFHPDANLVEYLLSPTNISEEKAELAKTLASGVAARLNITGLLAVEMFLDKEGHIVINEVAPRPHNSGHHTIESCNISQFEMHLRAILNLPLVSPIQYLPAVMVNILGADGYYGNPIYENIEKILEIPGIHPHIYGKKETRPFRKMGHITIVNSSIDKAKEIAGQIQSTFKVIS